MQEIPAWPRYTGVLFFGARPRGRRIHGHHPPPLSVLAVEGVSPELRSSVSYFASICSANVAIATPLRTGVAGQKKKAMQGAGPCMTLKPLARPDRRMISPPGAAPFLGRPFAARILLCRFQPRFNRSLEFAR